MRIVNPALEPCSPFLLSAMMTLHNWWGDLVTGGASQKFIGNPRPAYLVDSLARSRKFGELPLHHHTLQILHSFWFECKISVTMVEKLYVTYNQVCTLAILPMQSGKQARMRYVPQRAPTPCICTLYKTYNMRQRACTLHPNAHKLSSTYRN
jgi:hypothetical protein